MEAATAVLSLEGLMFPPALCQRYPCYSLSSLAISRWYS